MSLQPIIAGILIDRVGRRPLLIGGITAMVLALLALGAIFALGPQQSGYLILIVLLMYVIAFALSLGPVFWLMCAEILPIYVPPEPALLHLRIGVRTFSSVSHFYHL